MHWRVVAADTLDLAAPVPAPELGRLRTGLAVDVVQDGDTAVAHGWLAALAPGVDTLTNAGEAVIRVPNGAGPAAFGARRPRRGSGWASGTTLVAPIRRWCSPATARWCSSWGRTRWRTRAP
jgi:hypothetical protein